MTGDAGIAPRDPLPLLSIILVSATISVTLCCAVLLFGRFALGYRSYFPRISATEPAVKEPSEPLRSDWQRTCAQAADPTDQRYELLACYD